MGQQHQSTEYLGVKMCWHGWGDGQKETQRRKDNIIVKSWAWESHGAGFSQGPLFTNSVTSDSLLSLTHNGQAHWCITERLQEQGNIHPQLSQAGWASAARDPNLTPLKGDEPWFHWDWRGSQDKGLSILKLGKSWANWFQGSPCTFGSFLSASCV